MRVFMLAILVCIVGCGSDGCTSENIRQCSFACDPQDMAEYTPAGGCVCREAK